MISRDGSAMSERERMTMSEIGEMTPEQVAAASALLGVPLGEALEADERLRTRVKERDGRICICGHPMNRHMAEAGRWFCTPSRLTCKCATAQPVVLTSDTRLFLRKTEGSDVEHALIRGMAAALAAGKSVEWIDGARVCARCGSEGGMPVVHTKDLRIMHSGDSGYYSLLCETCRTEV